MKFMMIVKADKRTEAGILPTQHDLEKMDTFNQALIKAGALVDAAGLKPTSKGARVTYQNGKVLVTDGPFVETKELIAGFWIIDVASLDEAKAWARKIPFDKIPGDGRIPEVEIRPFYEESDFK